MNRVFEAEFVLRIEAALTGARQAGVIQHRGLVGQIRELLAREIIRPVLPAHVGVGTGKIVDHLGGESRQIDLVMYDRNVMPPLTYGLESSVGLFPIEACFYALEVKSKATRSAVREAVEVAESVAALRYVPPFCVGEVPKERVHCVLFAFDSTTRSWESERDRWKSLQDGRWHPQLVHGPNGWEVGHGPPLNVACVVDRGYGFFKPGAWNWLPPETGRRIEVLGLMAGIANSIPGMTAVRYGVPFGYYFTGE